MNGAASTRGECPSVFTQCSKCETVFKLSAEVLRAAGGQVRCGKCGEIFNALAHLAEDASAFTIGESSFELETRADSILQSPAPPSSRRAQPSPEDSVPPGIEIAPLQILDWNESDSPDAPAEPAEDPAAEAFGETSLEFTLPPGELDRIFVETKKGVLPRMPRVPVAKPVESDEPEEIEVFNAADPIVDISAPAAAKPKTPAATAATAAAAAGSAPAPSRFEVSEDVRREMLSGIELTAHPESLALERADRSLEDSAAPLDLDRQ